MRTAIAILAGFAAMIVIYLAIGILGSHLLLGYSAIHRPLWLEVLEFAGSATVGSHIVVRLVPDRNGIAAAAPLLVWPALYAWVNWQYSGGLALVVLPLAHAVGWTLGIWTARRRGGRVLA